MDAIKSPVLQILKNSSAQVCLSTPIRRSAHKKDEELAAIKANLYDLCSEFKEYSTRISIANLYSIGTFLKTNSEGKHTLTPRGESRLFLKLKDYMFTALGYSLHKEKSYYSYRRYPYSLGISMATLMRWKDPRTKIRKFSSTLSGIKYFAYRKLSATFRYQTTDVLTVTEKNSKFGGVCIGIHRSLEKHITHLETECEDIQAIKITEKS